MLTNWLWLFAIGASLVAVESLPTSGLTSGPTDEAKKSEQLTMRPKVKRAQELLMFGNQQNRQQATENSLANNFSPSAEKRTLSNSGLDDAISETEQLQQQQQQQQQQQMAASNSRQSNAGFMMEPQPQQLPPDLQQHYKNYEYGKVLVNEIGDVMPRGAWDLPPAYGRYYVEDRRKRSDDSSTQQPSSSSSTASPQQQQQQQSASQPKRSVPSFYQEPRYKRELDLDPDDFLALLTLYDGERRNRGNWRNYGNEEYETVDDDSNMIGIDDDEARSWLDNPLLGYPQQQQHHYLTGGDPLLSSELAALSSRGRPASSYYDQYLQQQQQQQAGQQQYADSGVQYGTPQYALPYGVQHAYYPPEKRYMVSRKRSQNYDTYGGRNGLVLSSRGGYPNYQHRLLY